MEEQFVGRAEKFAKWCDNVGTRVEKFGESIGNQLVDGFHMLALFVIGGTIAWSAVNAYIGMVDQGYAGIKDILLCSFISSSAPWSESISRPIACRWNSCSTSPSRR